jgi:hypothetical protein
MDSYFHIIDLLLWSLLGLVVAFLIIYVVIPNIRSRRQKVSVDINSGEKRNLFEIVLRNGIPCRCRHFNRVGRLHCARCGADLTVMPEILNSLLFIIGFLLSILYLLTGESKYLVFGLPLMAFGGLLTIFIYYYTKWARENEKSLDSVSSDFKSAADCSITATEYRKGALHVENDEVTRHITLTHMIQEIRLFIKGSPSGYFVGKTDDRDKCKNLRAEGKECLQYRMQSQESVDYIVSTFTKHGCRKDPDGEEGDTDFIYIVRGDGHHDSLHRPE